MNTFANAVLENATTSVTENGDKTFTTSLNANVDLFFKIAAIRAAKEEVAIDLFDKAYAEDADLATRILLWSRDIRGGAGERKTFRNILKHLERKDSERLYRIFKLIPEVGRWDDLFVFETTTFQNLAYEAFARALTNGNGLAAKWAPRLNSANKAFGEGLRKFMNLTPRQYRKLIVSLSQTVEQQMCAREWDAINFEHVPSVASARYSKAFWKHCADRYNAFLQKATKGEAKINTSALFPYDVTKRNLDAAAANALWKNLPDYVPENVSFMPVIDLSASMASQISSGVSCMDVAVSLGIYLAERNKSAFKNLALSFTSSPAWIRIPETDSIKSKLNAVYSGPVGYDTNLDRAMDAILDVAVKNCVPQSDLPKFLVVLSDMEFNASWTDDRSTNTTSVVERTQAKFKAAGYETPYIVWWNIQSRNKTTPVRYDANGMIMVSGASPTVMKTVLSGEINPHSAMLRTVGISRYDH